MSTKTVVRPDSAKVVPMTTKARHFRTSPAVRVRTLFRLSERKMHSTNGIWFLTGQSTRRWPAPGSDSRRSPVRCATSWRSAGYKPRQTYEQQNAKRIYYLSMEFLLGRSLANNVTNLLLDPLVQHAVQEKGIDWLELIEQEPDAGLGNGGLGRLAACFLDSMATMQLPATGYGLRYEYGMFRQSFVNGWQQENADNWLRDGDPWEIARPHEKVEVKLNCTFKLRDGHVRSDSEPAVQPVRHTLSIVPSWATAERRSTLSGCGPRPRPITSIFRNSAQATSSALSAQTLEAESLTRVLYPDDSTTAGQELRFLQEYFLVACSMADLVRRFLRHNTDWEKLPEKAAIQLNDTHPSMSVAELMRILLDDAHLGWDQAWDLTKKTLAYTNHTLLPEALEKWPVGLVRSPSSPALEIIYEINRRLLDEVRVRFPGDEGRVERVSLIEEGKHLARFAWPIWRSSARTARMAWPLSTRSCCEQQRSKILRKCFPSDSATRRTE